MLIPEVLTQSDKSNKLDLEKNESFEMEKPRTTKQHLIDKLILGKLPLHKRHRKMSQYGGHGGQDQELEKAMDSIELNTSNCINLKELCELRSQHFLKMVDIYIDQLDDELHREVAKHVLNKYRVEDGYIEMDYAPQYRTEKVIEKYDTVDNYASALAQNYKQVTFENRVSKMFSSIPERIPTGTRDLVTDSMFNRLCRIIDDSIYIWQKEKDRIFITSIGVTPEEYSELHYILNKNELNDLLFYRIASEAKCWLDEVQAMYEPDMKFYNHFFSKIVKDRVKSLYKEHEVKKTIRVDELCIKKDSEQNSEPDSIMVEGVIDRINYANSSLGSPPDPSDILEAEQAANSYEKWKESLSSRNQQLISLYLLGASRDKIAETIDSSFPETFKGTRERKVFKASNVSSNIKKLVNSYKKFLLKNEENTQNDEEKNDE